MKKLLLFFIVFFNFPLFAVTSPAPYDNCECSISRGSWVNSTDAWNGGYMSSSSNYDGLVYLASCTPNNKRELRYYSYYAPDGDKTRYHYFTKIDYCESCTDENILYPEQDLANYDYLDGTCEDNGTTESEYFDCEYTYRCKIPKEECNDNYSRNDSGLCIPDNPDDIDNDGIPNSSDPDIDGDGVPNWEDPDIDGDGVPNGDDGSPGGGGDGAGDVDDPGGDSDGSDTAECGAGAVYSYAEEGCVCLNGGTYPSCAVSECPISYGGLTLQSQNVTNAECLNSYPPSNGWEVNYMSDDYLSCCYASKNNTPDPCAANEYRNSDGICVEIPSEDPSCGAGEYLDTSGSIAKCLPIPCNDLQYRNSDGVCVDKTDDPTDCLAGYTWDNFSQGCVKDSTAGDGTGGDSNGSLGGAVDPYDPDDPDGDTIDEKVQMQVTDEEIDKETSDYADGIGKQFSDLLDNVQNDMLTTYQISIPVPNGCGCSNPIINYKGFSETVEICPALDTVFDYMRPILWLSMLITILFGFFRGGN